MTDSLLSICENMEHVQYAVQCDDKKSERANLILSISQCASEHLRARRHRLVRANLDLSVKRVRMLSIADDFSMQGNLCTLVMNDASHA